jgi:hypothetical protein
MVGLPLQNGEKNLFRDCSLKLAYTKSHHRLSIARLVAADTDGIPEAV